MTDLHAEVTGRIGYWKNGTIDYKKIPELSTLDVEQYRGAGREEVRVVAA